MAPPKSPGGNILTRKIGPLPGWAWAAVAVGGFLVYKQRKASQAASASAAAPITSTAPSTPIAQAPSGYGYQGPGSGGYSAGPIPTGAMSNTNTGTPSAFSPPTNEVYGGAGYGSTSGAGVVTSASGQQFSELMPGSTVPGGSYFYQPAPGIFQPIPAGANLAGAPYYIPVGASA